MARQQARKSLEDQYREIAGEKWPDCVVLSFVFDEKSPSILHYELLGRGIDYVLFDGRGQRATVVVPKRNEGAVREAAKGLDGKEISPDLR